MPAREMAGPDPVPRASFVNFVAETKKKHIGRNLSEEEPKPYVPLSALREYWTASNVADVLRAFSTHPGVDVPPIRRSYLRIFSILVLTNDEAVRKLPSYFMSRGITDDKLPWTQRPTEWPDEKLYNDFFDAMEKHQWQFYPFEFHPDHLYDRIISSDRILPISFREQLKHGTAASVRSFSIHPEYNHLMRRDQPLQSTFVLKTYHTKKHLSSYTRECDALLRLRSNASSNVVHFYGSFRQLGSYALLLEHADGGSMGDFFTTSPPPRTLEDIVTFWRSLFQVFDGLDRIHQLMMYNEEVVKGIHQDIRPENILIKKSGSGSPYRFTPKIADFELYSRVRTVRGGSGMGQDNHGNQRFSAPECCHHRKTRQNRDNMITTRADIFSIGAVLSHTVAWIVGGCQEQDRFFERRKNHHDTAISAFTGSGYEGCFHDSIEPLPVIAEYHKQCLGRLHPSDDITPKILEWVEGHMLVSPERSRRPAKEILEMFRQMMERRNEALDSTAAPAALELSSRGAGPVPPPPSAIEFVPPQTIIDHGGADSGVVVFRPVLHITLSPPGDAMTSRPLSQQQTNDSGLAIHSSLNGRPPSSSSSDAPQAEASQASPSPTTSAYQVPSKPPYPEVGITAIEQYKSDNHYGIPADPETIRLVNYLEHNLSRRDQFFFIDDSQTMAAHRATITSGFRALANIAKRLDPNKIELAFASCPHRVHRARRTRRLVDQVAKCAYRGDGRLMEKNLAELVDTNIIPGLPHRKLGFNVNLWARKKLSLYVFTDGEWGDGAQCGVEGPVRRIIGELKKRGLDRTQVSLHIVRFGDREGAGRHLERLDEFGKEDGWDIVDVKHISGAVAGMMIGPLSQAIDEMSG